MKETIEKVYLESAVKRLLTYKILGEKTFEQLEEKDFFYSPVIARNVHDGNEAHSRRSSDDGPSAEMPVASPAASNSIAVIIQHMSGNMMSRWTNFLTEDGEKEGRDREKEFSNPSLTREQLLDLWEKGWACLQDSLLSLQPEDLMKTIHIRHEPLFAIDAINRQLAHYPHHVGQIVYIGKLIRDKDWRSLSIPKGASAHFNQQMQDQHGKKH